ncbi:MAG: DUF4292 domain-containing protein [Bacteroidales bacterium]|jgi:hypothetical protein|nr:DUF4292 domain-containing protein [Bacteroidales bacterium]
MKKLLSFLIIVFCFSVIGESQNIDTTELFSPQWISYKMKVKGNINKENYVFQLFYVNRIDSIIYINFHISGIEIGRLTATPEEVIFVNKVKYEYYQGEYDHLISRLNYPLNFYTLQNLMNGTPNEELLNNPLITILYEYETEKGTVSFFKKINIEIPLIQMNFMGEVSHLKFNVPGPTTIKIPEKFTPIKF